MTVSEDFVSEGAHAALPVSPTWGADRHVYRVLLIVGDALVLVAAFALAYWLRFDVGVALEQDVVPLPQVYVLLTLELIPLWLILFAAMHLYDFHILLGGTTEYVRVANACASGMMIVVILSFFLNPTFNIARGWLVLAWGLSTVMVCSYRLVMRRVAYWARGQGHFVSPTLIVGTTSEARLVADQLRESRSSGLRVLGFVETFGSALQASKASAGDISVLGELDDLHQLIRQNQVREIILVPSALSSEQLIEVSELLAVLPNVEVELSSGLYEVFTTGMRVRTRNALPLMSLNRLRLSGAETVLKTMLDYAVILLALPILIPLVGIIAFCVKFDSAGPVFYRRRVMGVGGRQFDALKFRTMYVNGNDLLKDQYPEKYAQLLQDCKLKDDPRITRTGRILRRLSLDELPQLFNVMWGQMSLVGPRMISPAEHTKYGRMRANLLTVRPGLTGLWQVSGRSDLTYGERVRLDMYYVRNYSIWLDIQILFFQTLPAVVRGRGAY